MKRKQAQIVADRNAELLSQIKAIKNDHPLWGYRRIWSYLKYRQGIAANKKRIYRLMKEHNLIVTPEKRLKAKRGPTRPKPRAHRPNQFWGIDMTKIRMTSWGWLYLTVVLDWYSSVTRSLCNQRLMIGLMPLRRPSTPASPMALTILTKISCFSSLTMAASQPASVS